MKTVNIDGLRINGNSAIRTTEYLHAKYQVLKNEEFVYYELLVKDKNMETVTFCFYALEDVVSFTEDIMENCKTIKEVVDKYQMMFYTNQFRLPGGIKPPKKNTIPLMPDEVDQAIIEHFGEGKNYRVSVKEELYVDYQGKLRVGFLLTEHLDYNDTKKNISYMLTETDVRNALDDYISQYGYELQDYKIKTGISERNQKPTYEGIDLIVNQKKKSPQKKKSSLPKGESL